jgi:hypothetical protein
MAIAATQLSAIGFVESANPFALILKLLSTHFEI